MNQMKILKGPIALPVAKKHRMYQLARRPMDVSNGAVIYPQGHKMSPMTATVPV